MRAQTILEDDDMVPSCPTSLMMVP